MKEVGWLAGKSKVISEEVKKRKRVKEGEKMVR